MPRSPFVIVGAGAALAACSFIESFDGYSDEFGKTDAGSSSGGFGGISGSGGFGGGSGGTEAAAGSGGLAGSGGCTPSCSETMGPLSECVSGSCECRVGTVDCSGICTRTEADPLNCGSCGTVVDKAKWCVDGVPECRPNTAVCKEWTYNGSLVECDFACTDPLGDGSHCIDPQGTTQSRCYLGSGVTGRCVNGDCTLNPCPSDTIECPSTLSNVKSCFDSKRDANHCGACLNQCAADTLCANGACVKYRVAESCNECGSLKCCDPTPIGWAHAIVCVEGAVCPT